MNINNRFLGEPPLHIQNCIKSRIYPGIQFLALEPNTLIYFGNYLGEYLYSTTGLINTWIDFNPDEPILLSNKGDRLFFKAKHINDTVCGNDIINGFYIERGKCSVSGSIMSLLDSSCPTDIPIPDGCFSGLFFSAGNLYDATNLILPLTTLSQHCYIAMFEHCSQLKYAPRLLPAQTLTNGCYTNMFYLCSNLQSTPLIAAEHLAKQSCASMFESCYSLTDVSTLKFKTLGKECCKSMFYYCYNLKISDNEAEGHLLLMDLTLCEDVENWSNHMFYKTSGTFTDDPIVGTKYYTYK